jgi:hypothetical protein
MVVLQLASISTHSETCMEVQTARSAISGI